MKPGKYFHFLNTIESYSYDREVFCWRIRIGIIKEGESLYIYSFNNETGVIDYDDNATCFLREKYIYKDLEECIVAMRDEFDKYIARKEQELIDLSDQFEANTILAREIYGDLS